MASFRLLRHASPEILEGLADERKILSTSASVRMVRKTTLPDAAGRYLGGSEGGGRSAKHGWQSLRRGIRHLNVSPRGRRCSQRPRADIKRHATTVAATACRTVGTRFQVLVVKQTCKSPFRIPTSAGKRICCDL